MPLGQCVPIARGESMASGSGLGETFSHFVSAEFDKENEDHLKFRTKLKGLQDLLIDIPGIGKAVKADALHITLAVLHLTEKEIHGVTERLRKIWEEYTDLLGSGPVLQRHQLWGPGLYLG